MPFVYELVPEHALVSSRAWGLLTNAELFTHAARLTADPHFHPGFRELLDLRGVTQSDLDEASLLAPAMARPFAATAKRAIVVSSPLSFDLAQMYRSICGTPLENAQIFRQLNAALVWLDLAEEAEEFLHRSVVGDTTPAWSIPPFARSESVR